MALTESQPLRAACVNCRLIGWWQVAPISQHVISTGKPGSVYETTKLRFTWPYKRPFR
jgi:hypothetical protein